MKGTINNSIFFNFCSLINAIKTTYDIITLGGASVRRLIYNWWEANMVIPSKEPLVSLGATAVR